MQLRENTVPYKTHHGSVRVGVLGYNPAKVPQI